MQAQPILNQKIIDDKWPIAPLHPAVFDQFLADGWRLLARRIVRHNFANCRGQMRQTLPLRIRLDGFQFSKSQRRLLRRNADLEVRRQTIRVSAEKEQMFYRHCQRLRERRPELMTTFVNEDSAYLPVPGYELDVFDHSGQLIAASFFHLGETAVSGTYCFYEPGYDHRSLGTYTMLLELEMARAMGKAYYYHGYCYDVPSQFDYKLNFNNLEYRDWETGLWLPKERVPVRDWMAVVEEESGVAASLEKSY